MVGKRRTKRKESCNDAERAADGKDLSFCLNGRTLKSMPETAAGKNSDFPLYENTLSKVCRTQRLKRGRGGFSFFINIAGENRIGVNLEKLFLTFRYPQNRKYFVICKRILFLGKVQSFLINTARFGGFFCLCFFRVCNKGIIRQAAAVKRLFLFAFLWEIFYFRDCLNCKCLKKPAAFYIAQCRPQICGVKPAFAEEKFCPV